MATYGRQVFLNVPFDARYRKLLRALVFGVHECGLLARCAQEKDDGGQVRVNKLFRIIRDCRFGIHDLSRTSLDSRHRLPRFNMPLELGLFLGARRYGPGKHRRKVCLILDRDRYRWLQTHLPPRERLPGPASIANRYLEFRRQLPYMCRLNGLRPAELSFLDYRNLLVAWLKTNPR